VRRGNSALIYPCHVKEDLAFDLLEFMASHFSRVELDGNLFEQWPAGLRFEIGIEHVSRAAELYKNIFEGEEDCVLVAQDWSPADSLLHGRTPLFQTPGIILVEPPALGVLDVSPFNDTPYRLTWTRLAPRGLDAIQMFQGIANREQPGSPKIESAVYVISPGKKTILHMYDDRGLDVIASQLSTLRPVFNKFSEWILDNQRQRIDFRFSSFAL
jgi:hypothetical protein